MTAAPINRRARRILVIAYCFAPASPIGTMRTLRLVNRLHAEGWQTTVVTVRPDTYEATMPMDPALLQQVPDDCRLVHAPVLRPLSALAHLTRPRRTTAPPVSTPPEEGEAQDVRGSRAVLERSVAALNEITSIPDRASGWIAPAVTRGILAAMREHPAVLYSSAPPWSGQIVALLVAHMTGIPWVADFRDPWARAPWRESQPERIRRAAVRLERHVVGRANAILFATQTNRDEYAAHYGAHIADKCHVVRNGCDPREFAKVAGAPRSDTFVLLHAGSIYGARTPVPLFRAIAAAIARGAIDRRTFRLRLIGATASSMDLPTAASDLGLNDVVEFVPRMRRHEIVNEMQAASCLLVLQPGTTVSIPGKLYEYLAIGRPILALSEEGETADLVRQSGVGVSVAPDDEHAIGAALTQLVANRHAPAPVVPSHLYDGNAAAGEAVTVIARVVGTRGNRRVGVGTAVEVTK